MPNGYYSLEKLLKMFIRKGVMVRVCGACIDARGLNILDLVEGVERGSMKILIQWISIIDKVINF
ncbi:MAG: DsrE family protein [archaeon]